MVTVNVVVLAGRLSDAPELKPLPSGDQVARFRLHVPEAGMAAANTTRAMFPCSSNMKL